MDVRCTSCGEPWDVYHLWHEAIFETGLSVAEAEAWRKLPRSEKLSKRYRAEFRAVGWEFGKGVINVMHCPCCPPGAQPDPDRKAIKTALEELMGNDEDGLAATFEDHQL
jgi:hypothetical protein